MYISDVQILLETADHIILSTGYENKLNVPRETLEYLSRQQISFQVLTTEEAVTEYNRRRESGQKVGALIHSTC